MVSGVDRDDAKSTKVAYVCFVLRQREGEIVVHDSMFVFR